MIRKGFRGAGHGIKLGGTKSSIAVYTEVLTSHNQVPACRPATPRSPGFLRIVQQQSPWDPEITYCWAQQNFQLTLDAHCGVIGAQFDYCKDNLPAPHNFPTRGRLAGVARRVQRAVQPGPVAEIWASWGDLVVPPYCRIPLPGSVNPMALEGDVLPWLALTAANR